MESKTKPNRPLLWMVFLTLFLDLAGFSIVFPLFPSIAKYYYHLDPNNIFLQLFDRFLHLWPSAGDLDHANFKTYVIFGGILSALYSIIQFFSAPFWGRLSDRLGRRPVLLISSLGMTASYLCWFFAGNFSLLIIGRILGGGFSGNVSTATAAVADLTSESRRGQGMAVVGLAFALGFILGPAMGGLLSLFDLTAHYPVLESYGINPFSVPAAMALSLALINFLVIFFFYEETLKPSSQRSAAEKKIYAPIHIFAILKPQRFPGVNGINWANFIFTFIFSGLEFTLIFLMAERFNYTPRDNAGMFIYIGFLLAVIQGGIVRRISHKVGYRRMTQIGQLSLVVGMVIIGLSFNLCFLYLGLTFMAIGSGFTIPCLTSLASLYVPVNQQGYYLGIYRSLSSLARALGPLTQAILYWRLGSMFPYIISPIMIAISITLIALLPDNGKLKEVPHAS